jgi:Aminoglycoside-2''-adenylyltransferase
MGIRIIDRNGVTSWPEPIGPACHQVFADLCDKLEGFRWFLMGRSLLAVWLTGRLDESDTDIDVACRIEDEYQIRDALAGWKIVQESVDARVHQLFYAPDDVLVDIHFFGPIPEHFGYKNMFNKWVTRPARRFISGRKYVDGYGDVGIPGQPEHFLHDDYGPEWRGKY